MFDEERESKHTLHLYINVDGPSEVLETENVIELSAIIRGTRIGISNNVRI